MPHIRQAAVQAELHGSPYFLLHRAPGLAVPLGGELKGGRGGEQFPDVGKSFLTVLLSNYGRGLD